MVSIKSIQQISLISIIFLLLALNTQAQEEDEEEVDWSERLIEEVKLENPVYKPIISIGTGILQFHGDVRDPYQKDILLGRPAISVDIYRALTPDFKFGFRFLYGQLAGNHYDDTPKFNRNFQTQMMSYGIGLTYNFAHIPLVSKREDRILSPYISLGAEFINYDTYGDNKTFKDSVYNYRTDGTIKDYSKQPASRVFRDYDYETSLSKENIDDLDDPTPVTLGIPIDMGFDFILSQKVQFRIGYSYHLTFNDLADNISTAGKNYDKYPERKGKKGNDNFSYAYASFTLDLFSKTTEERQLQFIDLGAGGIFDFWDMDGDFVMDIYDQCPWTPYRQLVDTAGCPLDFDKDGVPNYLDKEEATNPESFYIDKNGIEISEELKLKKLNDHISLVQDDIYRHYPSLLDGTGLFRRFYKTIPEKFKVIDGDADDYISLDELLKTIDNFFEGSTELTVDELYELNEFFFIQ